MIETLLRHPRLSVQRRTGLYGPKHDPYGFEEIIVQRGEYRIVYHQGLGTYLEFNGKKAKPPAYLTDEEAQTATRLLFTSLVGYSLEQIERFHRRLRNRCRKCGGKSFSPHSGFPGETLYVCDGCGRIGHSTFSASAIE